MEVSTKNLGMIAASVVALAAIVLVGMGLMTEYQQALSTETTVYNISVTPLVNTSVRVGTSGTYPYLQTLADCANSTTDLNTTQYAYTEGDSTGGYLVLNQAGFLVGFNNTEVNCTVTYLASTDASTSAGTFTTGLAIFGTFCAVVVLAIVGMVIITMFRKKD